MSWLDAFLIMGLLCLVVGVSLEINRSKEGKVEVFKKEVSPPAGSPVGELAIVVEVVGAVVNPGVFEMETGNRIFEFKRKPKENIGFVDREIGVELFVFLVLKADKPGDGGNQSQRKEGNEGN